MPSKIEILTKIACVTAISLLFIIGLTLVGDTDEGVVIWKFLGATLVVLAVLAAAFVDKVASFFIRFIRGQKR